MHSAFKSSCQPAVLYCCELLSSILPDWACHSRSYSLAPSSLDWAPQLSVVLSNCCPLHLWQFLLWICCCAKYHRSQTAQECRTSWYLSDGLCTIQTWEIHIAQRKRILLHVLGRMEMFDSTFFFKPEETHLVLGKMSSIENKEEHLPLRICLLSLAVFCLYIAQ